MKSICKMIFCNTGIKIKQLYKFIKLLSYSSAEDTIKKTTIMT